MTPPRTRLVETLAAWPATPPATRPTRSWEDDPLLCRFTNPAQAASTAATDDAVLAALARRADHAATTAALAAVAIHLVPVVRRWARSGLVGADLADAEAGLVAEVLALLRSGPPGAAPVVAQKAWHRVAGRRRTARARSARHVPLGPDRAAGPSPDDPLRHILAAISEAITAGAVTITAASALWAVVCGWSAVDAATATGCSASAWRDRRDRGRRAMRALDYPDGSY